MSSNLLFEAKLVEIVAVGAVIALSPLPAERVYEISNRSHGDSDAGINFSFDFGDGNPGFALEIEHPELFIAGFVF